MSSGLCLFYAKRYDKGLCWMMNQYAIFAIVRCFLVANGRVSRAITHQSQEDPRIKVNKAMNGFPREEEAMYHTQ